jgi:3'-phosphoadenosine 5'-phosphosulfate sulfotransferase (PAPS reductase)/FAD synthetase
MNRIQSRERVVVSKNNLLKSIVSYLDPHQIQGAERCAKRIQNLIAEDGGGAPKTVLVGYGGGKDSSYTLAFMRLVQLIIFRNTGSSFRLRVATNRHGGMPRAVMQNIDRSLHALEIYTDLDCEAFMIDGNEIRPFSLQVPMPDSLLKRNRDDILMTGHRTNSDARPTFCNACNISMVSSFGLAAAHQGGVDIIVTGDSRREQRSYLLWVNRLSEKYHLPVASSKGFAGFLQAVDGISTKYSSEIHGPDEDSIRGRRVTTNVPLGLQFFSIYDDTDYASGDHWELLTKFLGFQFDELAFSFTESDCANPLIMAHMRGLKCERLFGRGYDEGINEYVEFATDLMNKKDFPDVLVETVRRRYSDGSGIQRMRRLANAFAEDAFGLKEAQLVCMVYSPFINRGKNLESFLTREHPDLAGDLATIEAVLSREDDGMDKGAQYLTDCIGDISGMTLKQMRILYSGNTTDLTDSQGNTNLIRAILQRDPHKKVIQTRHTIGGPLVDELISGR